MVLCLVSFFPQYGGLVSHLAAKTGSVVREIDQTDQLAFLRVKSVKQEVRQVEMFILSIIFSIFRLSLFLMRTLL